MSSARLGEKVGEVVRGLVFNDTVIPRTFRGPSMSPIVLNYLERVRWTAVHEVCFTDGEQANRFQKRRIRHGHCLNVC